MLPARNVFDEQAGADDIAAAAFSWLKCEGVEVASGEDASSEHKKNDMVGKRFHNLQC